MKRQAHFFGELDICSLGGSTNADCDSFARNKEESIDVLDVGLYQNISPKMRPIASRACKNNNNNSISINPSNGRPPVEWNRKLFSICLLILIISGQSICQATLTKRAIKGGSSSNNNIKSIKSTNSSYHEEPANCHRNHTSPKPAKQPQLKQANGAPATVSPMLAKPRGPHNRKPNATSHHKPQRQLKAGKLDSSPALAHHSLADTSKQSAGKRKPPASPSRQLARGRQAACKNPEDNCHNNQQSVSESPASYTNGSQNEPPRQVDETVTTCSDCLPVRAFIGDERIVNDLIVLRKRNRQQQQSVTGHHRPYNQPAAPAAAILSSQNAHPNDDNETRRTTYSNYHQASQGYQYHPPPAIASLRPHSDDKCPMTGPLTICDQIGSYPMDVILSRLDNAKRVLRQSYFNLDSLFSDEREHSSDPFEEDSPTAADMDAPADQNGHRKQQMDNEQHHPGGLNNNFSHPNSGPNVDYYGKLAKNYANLNYALGEAPIDGQVEAEQDEQDNKHRALDYHTVRGYHSEDRQTELQQQQPRPANSNVRQVDKINELDQPNPRPLSGEQASIDTDEFVNLVKQRAISITSAANSASPVASNRKEASGGSASGGLVEGLGGAGYHHYRAQHQQSSHQQQRQVPIIILGKVLADRLLQMGDSLSKFTENKQPPSNTHTTDRSYQSYRVALSAAAATSMAASASTTFANTANPSHSIAGPSAVSKSRPRKRLRRQVAAPEVGGEGQQPARPAAAAVASDAAVDPERISEAANGGQPPAEPVCRAKSIYISPRAALNDKKQWKYIVNAADRDPQIRQIIRVDICEDPLGPCSDQFTVPFGFLSQCKQKYSKKKLLALDSQSGLLEVDTFFIPSCCVCQLVRERPEPEGIEMTPTSGEGASGSGSVNGEVSGGGQDGDSSVDGGSLGTAGPATPSQPAAAPGEPVATEGAAGDSFEAASDNDTGFDSTTNSATAATFSGGGANESTDRDSPGTSRAADAAADSIGGETDETDSSGGNR